MFQSTKVKTQNLQNEVFQLNIFFYVTKCNYILQLHFTFAADFNRGITVMGFE